MPRLTAELIWSSPAFINPLKERELDLRGNKIPQIENLGATEDQNDVIDLSDNEITKLENFPLLKRLASLFLNNNKICKIEDHLEKVLPFLETLVLTNNKIVNLSDLDPLSNFKSLSFLSLVNNPVTRKPHYRLYLIHKIPSLRVLDFNKVKMQEREASKKLFSGEEGTKLKDQIAKSATEPGKADSEGLSDEMRNRLKEAIKRAKSMVEVSELEHALATGKVPKHLLEQTGVVDRMEFQ
eukprot:TRINITY_DN4214_c0_g2_i1.p1 TRINITY_DN4214_c0_g2~~TRINITY_DN4214_c0_g2_i1.p1  ORF type:complete len:240 (+),score=39.73 TRINITY_DN4214_c0_g2_i1:138-857(+)